MSKHEKVLAYSFERYNGGVAIKRRFGSSTVTRFHVMFASDPGAREIIEGFGPTPGDRKTYAIKKFLEKRGLTPNRTSMPYGVMPTLTEFRKHLLDFTFDGKQNGVTDDETPVFCMDVPKIENKVVSHAAQGVPGVHIRRGYADSRWHRLASKSSGPVDIAITQVIFDDVAALHEFLVSLAHHLDDGDEDAGDLAASMMSRLGYEWD